MQILKKLTIKTCGDFTIARIKEVINTSGPEVEKDGKKVPGPIPEGGTVALLKIAGQSTSAKTGQTDKGDYTKLMGSFVGTDLTTGELYQAQVCILPQYIGALLGSALTGAEAQSVEFGFEIHAKRKDTSLTGYEFVIKPLWETKPTSALEAIMNRAGIALPAPKAEVPPAPAQSPEPPPASATKGGKK